MMLLTAVAGLLLLAGVVGCLLPRVPGIPASLAGVYLYWYASGYSDPSTLLLGAITAMGVLAVSSSIIADVVSTRIGDASSLTLVLAGAVGSVLLVFTGPIAMFLGTTITVFLLEYRRQRDLKAGARAALAVVVSSIGSRLFRLALAVVILLTMVVVHVL